MFSGGSTLNGPTSFPFLAAMQSLPWVSRRWGHLLGRRCGLPRAPTQGCPRLRCSQLPCRPQGSARGHGVQPEPALPLELQQQPRERLVTRFLLPSSVCAPWAARGGGRGAQRAPVSLGASANRSRGEPTAGLSCCTALGLGAISIGHPLPIHPVWPL